jgi:hypothetical protein
MEVFCCFDTNRASIPLMPITSRERLLEFAHLLQEELFPRIEEKMSGLSPARRLLIASLEVVSPAMHEVILLIAGTGMPLIAWPDFGILD